MYSKNNRRKQMINVYSNRVPFTEAKFCWVLDKVEREKKMIKRLARRYGTYEKERYIPEWDQTFTEVFVNKKNLFLCTGMRVRRQAGK